MDSATQIWVNALSSAPSAADIEAMDALVVALKASGTWAKADMIYDSTQPTAADILINVKSPGTLDRTYSGTGTLASKQTAKGFKGNNSDAFLLTGTAFSGLTQFQQNDARISAFMSEDYAGTTNPCPGSDTTIDTFLIGRAPAASDTMRVRLNHAGATPSSTFTNARDGRGLYSGHRSSSTNLALYKNGENVATDTGATSQARSAGKWASGKYNTTQFSQTRIAFEIVGAGNAAGEAADFAAIGDYYRYREGGYSNTSLIAGSRVGATFQGCATDGTTIWGFSDRLSNLSTLSNCIDVVPFGGGAAVGNTGVYTGLDDLGNALLFEDGTYDPVTGYLYICTSNLHSVGDVQETRSRILVLNPVTFAEITHYDITPPASQVALTSLCRYGTTQWWVAWSGGLVRLYNDDFSSSVDYTATPQTPLPIAGVYWDGVEAIGDYVFLMPHGTNAFGTASAPYSGGAMVFLKNGAALDWVGNLMAPTYGSGQGFGRYNNTFVFADRVMSQWAKSTLIGFSTYADAPDTPATPTATATGSTTATVTGTMPLNNGAAITSLTATSTPGSITGTVVPSSQVGSYSISVSGLTPSTSYTFTVHATNSVGDSTESAASNSITTLSSLGRLGLLVSIGRLMN